MQILSHRGYWKKESGKNSPDAFRRSFELGFGTETDVRDCSGKLVISHDPPGRESLPIEQFLDIYKSSGKNLPLAINIKADGLQEEIRKIFGAYQAENYFVFDMSVPDGLRYLKKGFRTFTRQSEYEGAPSFYEEAAGVWLDEFHNEWITPEIVSQHLEKQKELCIVSPELHGRSYRGRWEKYKNLGTFFSGKLMLCTDYPEEAREFFNGN